MAIEGPGDVAVGAAVEDEREVVRASRVEAQLDPLADEVAGDLVEDAVQADAAVLGDEAERAVQEDVP